MGATFGEVRAFNHRPPFHLRVVETLSATPLEGIVSLHRRCEIPWAPSPAAGSASTPSIRRGAICECQCRRRHLGVAEMLWLTLASGRAGTGHLPLLRHRLQRGGTATASSRPSRGSRAACRHPGRQEGRLRLPRVLPPGAARRWCSFPCSSYSSCAGAAARLGAGVAKLAHHATISRSSRLGPAAHHAKDGRGGRAPQACRSESVHGQLERPSSYWLCEGAPWVMVTTAHGPDAPVGR